MKERPILFSGPMVRAILDGRKAQTRRVARLTDAGHVKEPRGHRRWHPGDPQAHIASPYGLLDDLLWVRETWHSCPHCGGDGYGEPTVAYRAGGWMLRPGVDPGGDPSRNDNDMRPLNPKCAAHKWKPSIHMPRWASRLTLRVTDVRVQRLHDISEEDARAEGVDLSGFTFVTDYGITPARDEFAKLWESINGKRPGCDWASNPWVWAVTFEREEGRGAA